MLLDAIVHDEVLIEVKGLHGSLLDWNISQRHLTLAIMLVQSVRTQHISRKANFLAAGIDNLILLELAWRS